MGAIVQRTLFVLLAISLEASAEKSIPPLTPLEEQAQQTLFGDEEAAVPRDFLRTALRSTAEATLRQPYSTLRLAKAMFWRRGLALLTDNNVPVPPLALPQAAPPEPGTPEFAQHLDRLPLPKARSGTLDFFVGGPAFFDEFEQQVGNAKESIAIQVFIFDNDDVSVRCADLLRERARDIPVRVLIDDLGSTFAHTRRPPGGFPPDFVAPADIGTYLTRDSSLQLRQSLNPWLVTDHTKLLIFDNRTTFLGGMNLGRESRQHWHDLMVRVRGPIVPALVQQFEAAWRKNGPRGDLALLDEPVPLPDEPPEAEGVPLRILRTDAVQGRDEILTAMMHAIRGARSRIWIETPYFAMDRIERELEAASERGVDVRLILPNRANHGIMDAANYAAARNLLESGAQVFHYPGMTHLKAMICDGWAIVGSANLDTISLRINRELNLSFDDPALVRELVEQVFEPDFEASKLLTVEETRRALGPLFESLADQL